MPEYKPNPLNKAGIRSFNYPGHGERISEALNLCHAQIIPANAHQVHIVCQLGNEEDSTFSDSFTRQIELAFASVEKALHAAGVTNGWQQVYSATLYCRPGLGEEDTAAYHATAKKYLGDNRPVLLSPSS